MRPITTPRRIADPPPRLSSQLLAPLLSGETMFFTPKYITASVTITEISGLTTIGMIERTAAGTFHVEIQLAT